MSIFSAISRHEHVIFYEIMTMFTLY